MRRTVKAAVVATAAVLGLGVGTAHAGNYVNYQTYVSLYSGGGGYAAGVVSAARNSSDAQQYIGCQVIVSSSGTANGTCYANELGGEYLVCSSSVPALIEQMRSISDNSFVSFNASSTGACTSINVHQSSRYTAASGGGGLVLAP